ncbi:MAG: hypothetical protein OHK0012_25980 [Synechococcales cyanobacterium]
MVTLSQAHQNVSGAHAQALPEQTLPRARHWKNTTRGKYTERQWRCELDQLLQRRQQLMAQGIKPGWIVPYPVERKSKNGKIRTYTYYHYCFWDPDGKSVRKIHIPQKQLVHYEAECIRNQEAKKIQKRIQFILRKIHLLGRFAESLHLQ